MASSVLTAARASATTSTHRSSGGVATRGKFSFMRKSQLQQNFATTIPNKNNSKSGQRHSSVVLHSRMKVSANAAGGG